MGFRLSDCSNAIALNISKRLVMALALFWWGLAVGSTHQMALGAVVVAFVSSWFMLQHSSSPRFAYIITTLARRIFEYVLVGCHSYTWPGLHCLHMEATMGDMGHSMSGVPSRVFHMHRPGLAAKTMPWELTLQFQTSKEKKTFSMLWTSQSNEIIRAWTSNWVSTVLLKVFEETPGVLLPVYVNTVARGHQCVALVPNQWKSSKNRCIPKSAR